MKKNLRILFFIGVALLCAALAVYVQKKSADARAVSERKARSIAEEKEKIRQAELDRHWLHAKRADTEGYFVRQPVSEEIKRRAAELGIEISPFFDSAKIASMVIPEAKVPLSNSDPEFARLLKEISASDAEIAEEKAKWWEKNGEQYMKKNEKIQEFFRNNPEVVEVTRRYEKRMEEVRKMKGLSAGEFSKLQYEAAAEANEEMNKIRKRVFPEDFPPPANGGNQRK